MTELEIQTLREKITPGAINIHKITDPETKNLLTELSEVIKGSGSNLDSPRYGTLTLLTTL